MDCSFAALLTCFHLSGLYVDSALSIQNQGAVDVQYTYSGDPSAAQVRSLKDHYNDPRNPYASIALGYELDIQTDMGRLVPSLSVRHYSSPEDGHDRGINSINFGARWYPFSRP